MKCFREIRQAWTSSPVSVLLTITTAEGGAARLLDIPAEVREAEIRFFETAGFPGVRFGSEA